MSRALPGVLTPDEVANMLRCEPADVIRELEAGRLRGFKIAQQWRTTEEDLMQFMRPGECKRSAPPHQKPADRRGEGPDVVWEGIHRPHLHKGFYGPPDGLADIEWQSAPGFTYRWPRRAGALGGEEHYSEAFVGIVKKNGRPHPRKRIVIGFTNRDAVGMSDRRRAIVFMAHSRDPYDTPTLYPLVEFAGANDYATSRLMASVIKLHNRRQITDREQLPKAYDGFDVAVYSDVVSGPYAANGLAVVVRDDDLDRMARHAMIRRLWKGRHA